MTEKPSLTGKKEALASFWLKLGTFRFKLEVTFGQDWTGRRGQPRTLGCREPWRDMSMGRGEAEIC